MGQGIWRLGGWVGDAEWEGSKPSTMGRVIVILRDMVSLISLPTYHAHTHIHTHLKPTYHARTHMCTPQVLTVGVGWSASLLLLLLPIKTWRLLWRQRPWERRSSPARKGQLKKWRRKWKRQLKTQMLLWRVAPVATVLPAMPGRSTCGR